ncbi:MAG: rhomboid family intramembrane serine protease [Flavipsychrobacter sp.]|nr:rhomboid family intramembrane serine protease [Flavipsychrobacter sp.]
MFGSTLENMWGPKRFAIFYMVCGLGAALCHMGVQAFEFEAVNNAFNAYQQNATADQFQQFVHKYVGYEPAGVKAFRLEWLQDPSSIQHANYSKKLIYEYIYGGANGETGKHFPGLFDTVTVGASGAIYGLLFAFGYLFPNQLLYVYFLFPVKAKWAITALVVLGLIAGFQNRPGDNIAHFAHLGGMLFAFILLKIWNKRNRNYFY